jgi:hypothetical protein
MPAATAAFTTSSAIAEAGAAKARAAIDALHIQEAASVAELDAITTFVEGWSARAFAVAMSESSV